MRKKDEKLLEKVAGYCSIDARWFELQKWKNKKGRKWYVGDGPRYPAGVQRVFGPNHLRPWNPFEDSALAFSLAAEHELITRHHALLLANMVKPEVAKLEKEPALRYAIVRTLAELADMPDRQPEQEQEQEENREDL